MDYSIKESTEEIKKITGRIFKLLPIFEGKDLKTKKITVSKENSLRNFLTNLEKLLIDINLLLFKLDIENNYEYKAIGQLIPIMMYFRSYGKDDGMTEKIQHRILKEQVFKCIEICNNAIEKLELGG